MLPKQSIFLSENILLFCLPWLFTEGTMSYLSWLLGPNKHSINVSWINYHNLIFALVMRAKTPCQDVRLEQWYTSQNTGFDERWPWVMGKGASWAHFGADPRSAFIPHCSTNTCKLTRRDEAEDGTRSVMTYDRQRKTQPLWKTRDPSSPSEREAWPERRCWNSWHVLFFQTDVSMSAIIIMQVFSLKTCHRLYFHCPFLM